MKKLLILALAVLTLSSCMTTATGLAERKEVKVKYDSFDDSYTLLGITKSKQLSPALLTSIGSTYLFRTFQFADQSVSNQLYVSFRYNYDWLYFNRATTDDGTNFSLRVISREVGTCSQYFCWLSEDIALSVPINYMKNNKAGFNVKLYSKAGTNMVIHISKKQITAQLKAINNNF